MSGIEVVTAEVVELRPDDVVLIHLNERITMARLDHLKERVAKRFPGHEVLVVEKGVRIEFVREEAAP